MTHEYQVGDQVRVLRIDVNSVRGSSWSRANLLALEGGTGTVKKLDGSYLHVEFRHSDSSRPNGVFVLHREYLRPVFPEGSNESAAYIDSLHDKINALVGGSARANIELKMIDDILTGNESGYMYNYWTSLHDRVQSYVNMNGSKTALLALHKIRKNHPEIVQALLDADDTIDIHEITTRFPLPAEGKGD